MAEAEGLLAMHHIWQTVGLVLITAFMLMLAVDLVRPYVPWLIVAGIIVPAGKLAHRQYMKRRYW